MLPIGNSVSKIAVVGTHTPRQCGIATFTADLIEAISTTGCEVFGIAMEDKPNAYAYPPHVQCKIDQNREEDYRAAAHWITRNKIDALCIQHEFGIFGGTYGSYVLNLMKAVGCPIVTTLHTILEHTDPSQRSVFLEILRRSTQVVVMSEKGASILRETYGVESSKITIIPHGIPVVPRNNKAQAKRQIGYDGNHLILTFGLLSPDKAIEDVITALPTVLKHHPKLKYLVVGATHPHVVEHHGETYREQLKDLAKKLGVQDHVVFENKFVSREELTERLQAADVYITPYRKKEQITSGTLAYAFGSGNAVISTPYWHAQELLANGKGILVPRNSPACIASAINDLLGDPGELERLQAQAFQLGLEMQWPEIGAKYLETISKSRKTLALSSRIDIPTITSTAVPLPGIQHLLALADDVGTVQHARANVPYRPEGYCLDDNARSLLVLSRIPQHHTLRTQVSKVMIANMSFVFHAFDNCLGEFKNFMTYDRRWTEVPCSEDAIGRSIWALASMFAADHIRTWDQISTALIERAIPLVREFKSVRGKAFTLLGLSLAEQHGVLHWTQMRRSVAKDLWKEYALRAGDDWPWIENILAYDNAQIPHALLASAALDGDAEAIVTALHSLEWLLEIQMDQTRTHYQPIGCHGFYPRGGKKAQYDQQPLEAWATIEACVTAYEITKDARWVRHAETAYGWFFGVNDRNQSMIDQESNGCYDGLMATGPNSNQGAEAAISLAGSSLCMERLRNLCADPRKLLEPDPKEQSRYTVV
ncbi:MAG: glycosyltransferase family 4 protein [Armatimonadetes bacterium]|nr:glycosyltransferase family 4 protein [Armatimonadota bacterium]